MGQIQNALDGQKASISAKNLGVPLSREEGWVLGGVEADAHCGKPAKPILLVKVLSKRWFSGNSQQDLDTGL